MRGGRVSTGAAVLLRVALAFALLPVTRPARATDHGNLDAGRPFDLDDARTLGRGEFALETGGILSVDPDRSPRFGADLTIVSGFATDWQGEIGVSPAFDADGPDGEGKLGPIRFGVLHGFRRMREGSPALALRGDLSIATEGDQGAENLFPADGVVRGAGAVPAAGVIPVPARSRTRPATTAHDGVDSPGGSSSTELRLRGILSHPLGEYGELHWNLDGIFIFDPATEERGIRGALAAGYAAPLGLPTRFDQTLLLRAALAQSPFDGEGMTGTVGVGYRRQVSVRGVFDAGIESDVLAFDSAPQSALRVVVGYSVSY